MKEERKVLLEKCVVILGGIEALTFALYINSGNLKVNSIWALPMITVIAFMALFALQKIKENKE